MSKFILKPEFADCQILTKTEDGTEILITKFNFTDYYGELLLKNNQSHLLNINNDWQDSDEAKKKSYQHLTPDVIILTSRPQSIAEKQPSQTVNVQTSKPSIGKARPRKA